MCKLVLLFAFVFNLISPNFAFSQSDSKQTHSIEFIRQATDVKVVSILVRAKGTKDDSGENFVESVYLRVATQDREQFLQDTIDVNERVGNLDQWMSEFTSRESEALLGAGFLMPNPWNVLDAEDDWWDWERVGGTEETLAISHAVFLHPKPVFEKLSREVPSAETAPELISLEIGIQSEGAVWGSKIISISAKLENFGVKDDEYAKDYIQYDETFSTSALTGFNFFMLLNREIRPFLDLGLHIIENWKMNDRSVIRDTELSNEDTVYYRALMSYTPPTEIYRYVLELEELSSALIGDGGLRGKSGELMPYVRFKGERSGRMALVNGAGTRANVVENSLPVATVSMRADTVRKNGIDFESTQYLIPEKMIVNENLPLWVTLLEHDETGGIETESGAGIRGEYIEVDELVKSARVNVSMEDRKMGKKQSFSVPVQGGEGKARFAFKVKRISVAELSESEEILDPSSVNNQLDSANKALLDRSWYSVRVK